MELVEERLNRLRELMERRSIDFCLVPTDDFHGSEYVGEYFKCRQYLSGFTGSAGTLAVGRKDACLWTDGRYFVQAARQLEGTGIRLMRMGQEGVPKLSEYLADTLPEGGCLAFDGRTINAKEGLELEKVLKSKHISLDIQDDLAGLIWTDRPSLSKKPIWILGEKYCGVSAGKKLQDLREAMDRAEVDVHILTSLDDIAWLLNLRGGDVDFSPVFLSYMMIWKDRLKLFLNREAVTEEAGQYLEQLGVEICPYDGIYHEAGQLKGRRVLLDPARVNYRLYCLVEKENEIIARMNPTSLSKAVKNQVEIENERQAHLKDGAAVTKFICWLKQNVGKIPMDEQGVSDYLEKLRREQEGFLDLSFSTISAYGANAAMCHYSAAPDSSAPLRPEGLYLVDSGGHYLEGTTDVTRTIALGTVTDEQKKHFTLVLMGMLRLADVRFLEGCRGVNLDYAAREPLWSHGLDFNHGTGHGVGYLLNVHEGPNGIRWKLKGSLEDNGVLELGMITSDEPGLYIEGKYGIRTENLLLCVEKEKNEYGRFLGFEHLTFAPIDRDAIDVSVMTERDVRLLNDYHCQVYEKIAPRLTQEEAGWLREATAPL